MGVRRNPGVSAWARRAHFNRCFRHRMLVAQLPEALSHQPAEDRQPFIHDMTANAEDLAIVSAIINIAPGLSISTITEGVETRA